VAHASGLSRILTEHTMPACPLNRHPLRTALALFVALTLATAALAQTGSITGRVTDASTGLALGGARVAVPGTNLVTFAGPSGDYVLNNVPAGSRSLEVSYVGYPARTEPITVADGGSAQLNVLFGEDVVALDTLTIQGAAVGSARAINQQRAADTLTNIVAADAIGSFPDQNAAESLQRLPGVSLYRDQGEGRFIVLRGMNYTLGNVTLNGATVASPEFGERALALDVVPSDSLAAIEVTKVPTPDMSAEGLGGSINLRTKSPFDSNDTSVSVTGQGIYSKLSEKFGAKLNAEFSTLFAGGKAGLLVAATWQERKFGSYNVEIDDGWTDEDPATGNPLASYYLQDLAFRDYVVNRERYGINATFEYRPDSTLRLYVKANYNRFTDKEERHVSFIPFLESNAAIVSLSPTSAEVTGMRRVRRDVRVREKDQDLSGLVFGAEKHLDAWLLDARAAFSVGEETKPGEANIRFRRGVRDARYRYNFSDTYDVTVTQLAGASYADPASYNELQRVDFAIEEGKDTTADYVINTRRDLDSTFPSYVKLGGGYRTKEKESQADGWEYTGGPASFRFVNYAGALSDYPYFRVPRINAPAAYNFFLANRSAFSAEFLPEDSYLDDWTTNEDVLSGYAMASATFGHVTLIAGTRYERTEFDTTGNDLLFDGSGDFAGVTSRTTSRSYDNVLPGVFLRWDATKDLVVRASWSNSLVRPAFGDASVRRNINQDDGEVTEGNPGLDALESVNWDASVEYYLPSLGLISASVFHKQINNFTYEYEVPGGITLAGTNYDYFTFRNGNDGEVTGIELAYQHQLRFLPAPFNGLGVLANVTFADSEATYYRADSGTFEKAPFIGQSDRVGNVGLSYENKRFFIRLALNFRSERLREDESIGGNSLGDFWIDKHHQLDLTSTFRLGKNWEIFAEMTNLTNEPFRVFQTGGALQPQKRFVQLEEYDWTANLGLRWKL
jgi:TonB-dependent receptor